MVVAETTYCGNSCDPKVKTMISDQVRPLQRHNWVGDRRCCSSVCDMAFHIKMEYCMGSQGLAEDVFLLLKDVHSPTADA